MYMAWRPSKAYVPRGKWMPKPKSMSNATWPVMSDGRSVRLSHRDRFSVVTSTAQAQRRNPGAEIHYRRTSSSGGVIGAPQISRTSDDQPAPQVVRMGSRTQSASGNDAPSDSDRPVIRRRPAVDDSGTGARPAILQPGGQNGDSGQTNGGWRRTDDVAPADKTAPAPATPADPQKAPEKKAGWRKANPDDQ